MLDTISCSYANPIHIDLATEALQGQYAQLVNLGPTKYHYKHFKLEKSDGTRLFNIHIEPKFPNAAASKLDFNYSKFNGLDHLLEVISLLAPPDQLKLSRLDSFADVEVPIDQIHSTIRLSRKKSCSKRGCYDDTYKGKELESFWLGQNPERLMVYNKSLELKLPDKTLTRIEIQQYNKKIPISYLTEIPKLVDHEPFKNIQFLELRDLDPQERKATILTAMVKRFGLHLASKQLGSSGNFNRDFGSMLQPVPTIPDLNKLFQNNLKKTIGGLDGYRKAN